MPALIITPDISADTCDGATGWARGQPDVERDRPGLRAEADEQEHEDDDRARSGTGRRPPGRTSAEAVVPAADARIAKATTSAAVARWVDREVEVARLGRPRALGPRPDARGAPSSGPSAPRRTGTRRRRPRRRPGRGWRGRPGTRPRSGRSPVAPWPQVADAEHGARRAGDAQRDEEDRRERVVADVDRARTRAPHPRWRRRASRTRGPPPRARRCRCTPGPTEPATIPWIRPRTRGDRGQHRESKQPSDRRQEQPRTPPPSSALVIDTLAQCLRLAAVTRETEIACYRPL